MDRKFSLAIIALVGIGVFALPATIALFAGQHSFYNIDATGNQIPCQKCHGDVKAELSSGFGYSPTTGTPGPHAKFKCEYCHRAEQGYSSGDDGYGLIYYKGDGFNGDGDRSLVISIYDYETKAYPGSILAEGDISVAAPGVIGSISPDSGTGVLKYAGSYLRPAYRKGEPIDTNPSTRFGGFDPTRITNWKWGRAYYEPADLDGAGSRSVNPGSKYHAASLVSCMECHGGEYPVGHYSRLIDDERVNTEGIKCGDCHYGEATNLVTDLRAGGFGLTEDLRVDLETGELINLDTGEAEAHNAFVKTDPGNILRYQYGAANAACVSCHTHVAVDINFTNKYKIKFDAVANSSGEWYVGGYSAEGNVSIPTYGNRSGGTYATGNKSINWVPGTDLYINGTGARITGLYNATDDSEAALTAEP